MTILAGQQLYVKMRIKLMAHTVQRIVYRCAHLQMTLEFDDFDETVFIACPLSIRHSI